MKRYYIVEVDEEELGPHFILDEPPKTDTIGGLPAIEVKPRECFMTINVMEHLINDKDFNIINFRKQHTTSRLAHFLSEDGVVHFSPWVDKYDPEDPWYVKDMKTCEGVLTILDINPAREFAKKREDAE